VNRNAALRASTPNIDLSAYRSILKDQSAVQQAEKVLADFKPVDYDVKKWDDAVSAFEGKAVSRCCELGGVAYSASCLEVDSCLVGGMIIKRCNVERDRVDREYRVDREDRRTDGQVDRCSCAWKEVKAYGQAELEARSAEDRHGCWQR